ncbi:MAG: MepB family protein [Parachlamydiaceae bacterium]|nr:MepB family protein [Parachlamydiaceae bacterium]
MSLSTSKKECSLCTAHPDLLAAIKFAYEPCGMICENFEKEAESEEYAASVFRMNDRRIKYRIGKVTPTKIGQFVTLWKRIGDSVILPHDLADEVDLFIVSVRNIHHFGQFVFPKSVLFEKGVISKEGKGGKRAIRIYPPWETTVSSLATKSQAWQVKYFFEISENGKVDSKKIKTLFMGEP